MDEVFAIEHDSDMRWTICISVLEEDDIRAFTACNTRPAIRKERTVPVATNVRPTTVFSSLVRRVVNQTGTVKTTVHGILRTPCVWCADMLDGCLDQLFTTRIILFNDPFIGRDRHSGYRKINRCPA